ncbi:hypothetical protein Tsubulata_044906, partial [Turnera subulata]
FHHYLSTFVRCIFLAASGIHIKYSGRCPLQTSSQLPLIRQGRKCSQLVDCLSLDGVFSSGPAALLSGLKPSPEPGPPFFSCCNISCWLSTGAISSKAYGLELDQF